MLFDGVDITSYFRVKEIFGRGMIKNEISLKQMQGMDGSFYVRKRIPSRRLRIKGNIVTEIGEDLRVKVDQLNRILNVDKPVSIIFPDEPNFEYFGIPSRANDGEENFFMHKGELEIICPDPIKYGKEIIKTVDSGSIILNNAGSSNVYPTVDINIDANYSELTLSNGLDELRIIFNFTIGDTVKLDFNKRKVYINGNLNMSVIDLNKPTFFPVRLGDNTITITPALDATITYRESWL